MGQRLKIRIKVTSPNMLFFIVSMFLMTVMTIINGNQYVAGLAFVWVPSSILLLSSLLVKKENMLCGHNLLVLLLAGLAVYSTYSNPGIASESNCLNLVFCCISYIFVSSVVLKNDDFTHIIRLYALFGFIIGAWLLLNSIFSIGVRVFSAGNVRVSITYFGILKDVNYLSAFIVPAFTIYFYKGCFQGRLKHLIMAGIIFVGVFFGGSRSCFIAMILAVVIIVSKYLLNSEVKNKGMIIIALVLVSSVLFFVMMNSTIFERTTDFANYGDNTRLIIWNYAMEGFYQNPIFGSGTSSGTYYSQLHVRWVTHSCFVDLITAQGIIGCIIIFLLFLRLFRVNKSNKIFMLSVFITFFLPLFFIDGYVCATFWMPMTLCRLISKKALESENILEML